MGGDASALAGIAPTPAIAWLDDYLLVVRDWAQASAIQHLFGRLGLAIHPDKCEWTPTSRIEYLGVVLDVRRGRVKVPAQVLDLRGGIQSAFVRVGLQSQSVEQSPMGFTLSPWWLTPPNVCEWAQHRQGESHRSRHQHTYPSLRNQCSGYNFKNTVAANNEPCCTCSLFCSYLHVWSQ